MLDAAHMRDPIRLLSWLIVVAGLLLVVAYVLLAELQPLATVPAAEPAVQGQRWWPGIVSGGVVALLGGLMLLMRRWGREASQTGRPGSNGHP
jgi:hypothetical protein